LQQCNDTQLKLAWLPGMVQSPAHSLTLVVKGCFDLAVDDKATFCTDPDVGAITGDVTVDNKPSASLLYANDLVIYKPKADLSLSGVAYPLPGEAGCRVIFAVGNWRKSLAVFNDRYWDGGSASAPAAFNEDTAAVPLTYENAFGGANFSANPVGKGLDKVTIGKGEALQPLPNIEHIDRFLSSPSQKSLPAGFGPLKDNWGDKTPIKGTYGDKWLKEHFPYFPADFDWGYFNTAPADQQVAYLAGDESLYFENLHPQLPHFNSQLPALRPRLFIKGQLADEPFFTEVTLRLDSLHVDMQARQVHLLWRGIVGVQDDEFEEVSHACLYLEDMATDKQPQAVYLAQFEASELEADTEHQLEPFESEQGQDLAIEDAEVDLPKDTTDSAALEDEAVDAHDDMDTVFAEQFDNIKKQMREANMPTELVDAVEPEMDPMAFMDKITKLYNLDFSAGEALIAKSQQDLKDLFTAHGHDAGLLDFNLPEPAADEGEDEASAAAKEPKVKFDKSPGPSEQDMASGDLSGADLSNQDLSERDFKEADFSGANLSGANISGSDFSAADLSQANLSEVNAQGAIFDNAIMTGIDASGADFTEASAIEALCQQAKFIKTDFTLANLSGADFTDSVLAGALFCATMMEESLFELADLSQCQFLQVKATGANFNQANLRESFAEKSNLCEANFSQARLSLANFEYSDLSEAILESIDAQGIRLFECTLSRTRAGESSDFTGAEFIGGSGEGIIFVAANLSDAMFENIVLQGADFTEANLSQASFRHCDMKNAELVKADLSDTKLVGVNLFQANFTKATLTRTDLALTNLYGAEFYQASLQDANFKGANIKQTKIELGMVK
jgi:uncharacterized protein YjbI with pentapeptide repeats